ncbi:hypothetical protein [Pseudomonas azotoformans]|uniref:Uncharacterized protein n=1 Tax=Pseudomonas azotoformans TaxID=47878 RepID=A0A127I5D5_PSEAZ|nr:hypothetical protein [Pseudomonas azotoformans]AMN82029.1 hypothetical protein AYR47_28615 [Pseudomonas azotoformans]
MAKKPISKKTSSLQPAKTPPRPPKKPKAQFPFPIVKFAANNSVLYPMEAINGTEAKLTLPAGATDCTFFIAIKGQAEPAFEPIFVEDGDDVVPISAQLLSLMIGHTVLMWCTAFAGAKEETSLVLELEVQLLREEDLVVSRPVFKHSKNEWNTWWLRMQSFAGDETVEVEAWPFIFPGQRLFITVAGNQHTAPYRFIWVALDHVVQPHEAHTGYVFRFPLSRPWMSRLDDYSALTAHLGVIWDGTSPVYPDAGDPLLENPLPINAQDFHLRTTTLLQVDPYQDLNPSHLLESVELPPGHWQVNPTNTVKGGHAVVNYAGMAEGDLVCAQAQGRNYGPIALGCQKVKAGESSLSFDVPPKVLAALFNKTLTLDYTLQFNHYAPQSSPQRNIDVLAPQLPRTNIEEATSGTLDLSTFVGDATGSVPIFDYAAEGQCCWMWVTGELENGSVYQFDILGDEPLTADWVAKGVDTLISRAKLKALADCTEFQLHFAVGFDGKCNRATAIEFPTQGFKIEQEPLVLVEPKVTEAVLDQLTAYNGRNGVHVEVNYVGNNPKHTLSVCWKKPDGTCWPLASKPGSASGSVIFTLPPEAVIESMGKVVEIIYTVTTACKVQTSSPLNLNISLPVRLETPNVRQATPPRTQNAILDTRTFTGNAESFIDWMWFLRAGQKCWLRATAIDKTGAPYSFVIYAARTITAGEEAAAVEVAAAVLRSELDKAKDQSSMTLTFSVVTDGSGLESNAIVCPSRVLIIRVPFYDHTSFDPADGGWNGWQRGAGATDPRDLVLVSGPLPWGLGYWLRDWGYTNTSNPATQSEKMFKIFIGLDAGRTYTYEAWIRDDVGIPLPPRMVLTADGKDVTAVREPGTAWELLKGTFVATSSTVRLGIDNRRMGIDPANDFAVTGIRVFE